MGKPKRSKGTTSAAARAAGRQAGPRLACVCVRVRVCAGVRARPYVRLVFAPRPASPRDAEHRPFCTAPVPHTRRSVLTAARAHLLCLGCRRRGTHAYANKHAAATSAGSSAQVI